jgi:hypothetical protein
MIATNCFIQPPPYGNARYFKRQLIGYHVVVGGRAVALLTLDKLALAGFSPTHDVQSFEVADEVKAGSILFLHRSDGMLHHDPGEGATPIGVTTRDLAPHSVIRPSFDGFILLDGQFNLTEKELAMLTGKAAQ